MRFASAPRPAGRRACAWRTGPASAASRRDTSGCLPCQSPLRFCGLGPLSSATHASASTPPGSTHCRVELVDIGLNLLAASLVDELPPPHAPGVGQAHSSRCQLAPDVVDAFAEHHLDPVGPLAVDHDVQGLPGFRYAYLDLLCDHQVLFPL